MSAGILFDAPGPKARRRHLIGSIVGAIVALGILWLVYKRLDDKGQFAGAMWKPFTEVSLWRDTLLPGLWGTLKAALISIAVAAVLGGALAVARMSEIAPLRWFASVWVEIFRAIPVLLMMLFSYGVMTTKSLVDVDLAPLYATCIGLILYNSAVVCEVIRSGVDQLPKGQREGGLSIGLTSSQTLRMILLPQAITAMMPSLISQLIVLVKDTALGYNVIYSELLYTGRQASTGTGNIVPMMIVIAAIYIAINYSIGKIAEYAEGRLKRRGRTVAPTGVVDGAAEPGEGALPPARV